VCFSDLLGEEKPSFDLAETSYGQYDTKAFAHSFLFLEMHFRSGFGPLGFQIAVQLGRAAMFNVLRYAQPFFYSLTKPSHCRVPMPWNTNHVLAWTDSYLRTPVYVRKDSSQLFYTYPDLGGPFKSLDDVQNAVVCLAGDSGL
jgi:hypothetical protein